MKSQCFDAPRRDAALSNLGDMQYWAPEMINVDVYNSFAQK